MTHDNVAASAPVWTGLISRALMVQIAGIVLAIVAVVVILIFIPQTRVIGMEPSRAGEANVIALARTASHLSLGQVVGKRLTESDINGYLGGNNIKRMKVNSFSVDILEDKVRARMVRTVDLIDVASWRIAPKLSYDITAVTVNGRLRIKHARVGMLPLVGPLKAYAIRPMHVRLAVLPEWSACANIKEIQVVDDRIDVSLQKP